MFNVRGGSELSPQLCWAEQEHNKPFDMDTKMEERRHYVSHLGGAHLTIRAVGMSGGFTYTLSRSSLQRAQMFLGSS